MKRHIASCVLVGLTATAFAAPSAIGQTSGPELSPYRFIQLPGMRAGYREAGRILGELGLPTVVVQEGGYDLATIGSLVVETLTGVENSA